MRASTSTRQWCAALSAWRSSWGCQPHDLFVEAIVEFIQFFQLRPRHGAGWLLVDGIVTLILAIMIWRSWPASSVWVIGTLVGISMIFSGFSRLMLSLAAKRILNRVA